MIQKNANIIFPEFSYEIIMEILEKFELKEKHQQISEEMFSLPQGDPKFKILLESLPGRFLFTISRNYLNKLVKENDLPEIISEKLGLGIEKSKELLEDLDRRILSQAKIVVDSDDEEKSEPRESSLPEELSLPQSTQGDNRKDEPIPPEKYDPYREKIE